LTDKSTSSSESRLWESSSIIFLKNYITTTRKHSKDN
jgi:hypothetical protein